MKKAPLGFEKIGVIGVDSGTVMMADPCYWIGRDDEWGEFCDVTLPSGPQINFEMGHAGRGVVVDSGYGDGCYNVYSKKNSEGRTIAMLVLFDEEKTNA